MSETIDRSQPYHIRIPSDQSSAELHVGWRSYHVSVRETSWADISLTLPASRAKLLKLKAECKLYHQGSTWRAYIAEIVNSPDGMASVTLIRAEEVEAASKPKRDRRMGAKPPTEHRMASDPLILAIGVFGFLAAMLILPGWGDELGTSEPLTTGIVDFLKNVTGLFRN